MDLAARLLRPLSTTCYAARLTTGAAMPRNSRSLNSSCRCLKSLSKGTTVASFGNRKSVDQWFKRARGNGDPIFRDGFNEKAMQNLGIKEPVEICSSVLYMLYMRMRDKRSATYVLSNVTWAIRQTFEKLSTADPAGASRVSAVLEDCNTLDSDHATASEVIYLAAHRLWNSTDLGPELLPLARFALTAVSNAGNLKAAFDLAHIANLKDGGVIPPLALKDIRAAALNRTDWRAMTIYTRYLLKLQKEADMASRKLAFDLAQDLSSIIEPASPSTAIRLTRTAFHKWEPPWTLLRDAALQRLEIDYPSRSDPQHQEINKALISALRQGVNLYNDPDACRVLSDHPSITEYSSEWIDLKTKSAMDGHPDSCFNLARYYIEYWGWYPCTGNVPTDKREARIAFDWLELSAESPLNDAQVMRDRYLMLALLMRENGLRDDGHAVIKRGIQAIDRYSTDSKWRRTAARDLESFDRSWDFDFTHRVAKMLGDPKLSPEQRHRDYSTGGWLRWLKG